MGGIKSNKTISKPGKQVYATIDVPGAGGWGDGQQQKEDLNETALPPHPPPNIRP
jgi:hypothetical protein